MVPKKTYDAGGNLLIEADPGQATLFLPDEQLVENTVTGTVSGTRYYTIGGSGTSTSSGPAGNASASADSSTSGSAGGGTTASSAASSGIGSSGGATVACRTSSGTVDYLIGDQQKTAGLAIDASNLSVTRRYYDPYGNQVGTPPSSWPGDKGFVGGTASAATGLTNLGAREYQPQTETFISPDSILNPGDPQSLNPYAYASDNPATESDPSGQAPYPGIGAAGSPCEQFAGMCKSEAGTATYGSASGGGGQPGTEGCNHPHALDIGCHIATAGPTAPGGDVGFAAGLGDSLISAAQGSYCLGPQALICLLYQSSGLPTPESVYKNWVASKGVDTASSSTYGGGQIIGTLFILAGGGAGGAAGEAGTIEAAAEEAGASAAPRALEPGYNEPTELHHVLPQQFRSNFEQAGLNIDKATVRLPSSVHQAAHDVGWNDVWQAFFNANPNASASDITRQAGQMMWEFGLDKYSMGVVPYK